MDTLPSDIQRRAILQATAGLAAAGSMVTGAAQATTQATTQAATNPVAKPTTVTAPAPTGKPGDFDFLSGQWKIKNRQFKQGAWDEYDSEATVHGLLKGIASVEELRIPVRNFSGMGLRLLDVEQKLWADYWVNSKSGVLTPPPVWGSFSHGVGIWDSEDGEGEQRLIVRGAWYQITPTSCRWTQASSKDSGKTWSENWVMQWRRV
jgi:hypothetical protein